MDTLALNYRVCFRQLDENQITNFLFNQKEELLLPDKASVKQVANLLFAHGGVIGGFDPKGQMQAMIGFLFGDPQEAYANKDILFFYVLAIAKPYRQTRVFYKSTLAAFYECQGMGIDQFRMQAGLNNRYINKLYSKLARPLGESKTLRGQPVMTYGGSFSEVLARFKSKDPSVRV